MYNIVRQDGKDVHLVIKPDMDCVVNSGLGSVRGARMAENRRSDKTGTQQQRLTEPMVWRYGTWQPTSWDDALDLVARVTARVIDKDDEDDLFVSMFDHGGSAGGYENTWGTGKLYFGSMKVKNCRIHNRPAYNSEVHSTRDMGVDELNYAYEDYDADRHDHAGRHQSAGVPDQPVPEPHGSGHAERREGDHRRSAPHRDGQCLRAGRRQGERAAPGDQDRHGPGAVQHALHLHRRPGLGGQGLHRGIDLPGRRRGAAGRGASGRARLVRDGAREACKMSLAEGASITGARRGRHRQGGRVDRQAEGRRLAPQVRHRLREGHHLGQRQLPRHRRAGEHRRWRPAISAAKAAASAVSAATRKATSARPTPMSAGPRPISTS